MTSETMYPGKDAGSTRNSDRRPPVTRMALRKVWLPRVLYQSLPYFYVLAGLAAAIGTAYISDWFWAVPHYVLFAAGCVHLGVIVTHKRLRARRKRVPRSNAKTISG